MTVKDYQEPTTGMVSPWPHPQDHSCDNGLLYTALAVLWGRTMTFADYHRLAWNCLSPDYLLCRYPGQFGPGKDEQHDDYRAVMAILSQSSTPTVLAWALYQYGKNHWYCYNLEYPGKFDKNYWFGRYPGFIAVVKAGANAPLSLFDQAYFFVSCLGILIEAKNESNGPILQYLSCRAVERRGGAVAHLGIRLWRLLAKRKFPGGMKQVMGLYFPNGHPLTDMAPGDFK